MKVQDHFETERLIIRRWRMEDAQDIFDTYASVHESVRYISWLKHTTVKDTEKYLEYATSSWEHGNDYAYGIFRRDTMRLVGSIGFVNEQGRVFIGYIIGREYEGNGFASEAATCIVNYLSRQEEFYRIWACCAVENEASAKVLENAGMQFEGTIKDWIVFPNLNHESRDCHFYFYPKN